MGANLGLSDRSYLTRRSQGVPKQSIKNGTGVETKTLLGWAKTSVVRNIERDFWVLGFEETRTGQATVNTGWRRMVIASLACEPGVAILWEVKRIMTVFK